MPDPVYKKNQSQRGFTLVELAVVMIVIGLLIGGVLKGTELITNARVTATVAQIKGIEAATTTFRDMFDALPGDIINPGRLPGCIWPCNTPGDGNGQVDGLGLPNVENLNFWTHLAAADLITGIDPSQGMVWGGLYPSAEINGGFVAGL